MLEMLTVLVKAFKVVKPRNLLLNLYVLFAIMYYLSTRLQALLA